MKLSKIALSLVLGSTFIVPPHAQAFDWNDQTAFSIIQTPGRMEAPRNYKPSSERNYFKPAVNAGGHNLATRRGMDYAILKAAKDKQTEILQSVYGETAKNMWEENGFVFQRILWGNYSNEIQTMLDATEGAEGVAGKYMSATREDRHEVVGPTGHSKFWEDGTGYTSANPIHSMHASTDNESENMRRFRQENSLATMKTHTLTKLELAIRNLLDVKKAESENVVVVEENEKESKKAIGRFVKNTFKFFEGPNKYYKDSRYEYALRDLGSLFHTIQDSTVSCTKAAQQFVPKCREGDGHSILRFLNGKWKVISMSDGPWYARKGAKHAELDKLYSPNNLAPTKDLVNNVNVEGTLYGSFDPAIPVGEIILEVAKEVMKIHEDKDIKTITAYNLLSYEEKHADGWIRTEMLGSGVWPTQARWTKVAKDNDFTGEWVSKTDPLVKAAAKRIAETYVFVRYADQLQPMDIPPQDED